MSETEIHVSQIFPSVTAYQLIGTNSATTGDVYLTLAGNTFYSATYRYYF